jgi:hypothetical protein
MPYTGEIAEIVVGTLGLNGSKNAATMDPRALIQATNLTFEDGTMRKEGGAEKYNSTVISGTPKVLGGWDWFPTAGVQRMIVLLDDGTLKKDDGGGSFGTTLKSSLTVTDANPVFVEGGKEAAANNRKLFMFSAANVVQVLSADGTTTGDVATPPSDWSGSNQPTFGLAHEARMWGGGNPNDPHRLYYTGTASHEDFSAGGTLAIFPGDGEKLVGAISFKGLIICFKFPLGIYIVDTSNSDTSKWRVTKHTGELGGVSALGAIGVDDDIVFIDPGGNFHMLSSTDEFGDIRGQSLSTAHEFSPFVRENVNLAHLEQCRGVWYDAKREAHFGVAASGTVNNRRIVVDFNRLDIARFRWSDRDVCTAMWLRQDSDNVPRLTVGDDAGFVSNLDLDNRAKYGSGYTATFQTPHDDLSRLDPSMAAIDKNWQFLELIVNPKGNWTLAVDILVDGVIKQTVNFTMGTTGSTLGAFVLGTDKLAGADVLNVIHDLKVGSGKRISLIGRQSGSGQDFSIAKFLLYFTRGT